MAAIQAAAPDDVLIPAGNSAILVHAGGPACGVFG
jgi:hypothetical protein